MSGTRKEMDSMGEMDVPAGALYGAQTARAAENFPISGWPMGREFIGALGLIKQAAAEVNKRLGLLDGPMADAIIAAAEEVASGALDGQFVVDVFQTGSGTSTNMNANEVIASRASALLASGGRVHPNDHVNMGQSSNDVIPSAMHVAAAVAICRKLKPALRGLGDALAAKATEFDEVVKIGRTHLMDAVPIRLGQEFAGYAAQVGASVELLGQAVSRLSRLPIGGTAVGTGLNAPEGFGEAVCKLLAERTGVGFKVCENRFACQGARDEVVFASGVLRGVGLVLGKIASDIRLMVSGPRCGLGELAMPARQPGSSIMPGKVNPVICESVIQVACQVVGCDAAIAAGATGGVGSILELNAAMPMMAWNLLTAIRLLANAANVFTEKCIVGLEVDRQRCEELVERSLAMVTALVPEIGYDAAAEIAKAAQAEGKTIRQVCLERGVLDEKRIGEILDARRQTGR